MLVNGEEKLLEKSLTVVDGQADLFADLHINGSAYLELHDANKHFHTARYALPSEISSELRVNIQLLEIYRLTVDYYALDA